MPQASSNRFANLPFEFIVSGTPISLNPRRKVSWTNRVRAAATLAFGPASVLGGELRVLLVHYYRNGAPDVDNVIKPILDALAGVIYEDDALISQVLARKTELARGQQVVGASSQVLRAIAENKDFVVVRIDGPPEHGIMP